ncbi:hypothetical protein [Paenibacillus polymyxa]|uniref:DUF7210 family protein n=1 Tax=Paenibacillus polymyxa TaxID=1406 RepID=UPI003D2A2FB9
MEIEALSKIRHNGKDYAVGDVISGLDETEANRLVSLKSGKFVEVVGKKPSGDPITVEEFAKLKADEQKELLESLEFEAAGNVEGRVEQYTAWLDEKNALV